MSLQCDNLSGELQDQWSSTYICQKKAMSNKYSYGAAHSVTHMYVKAYGLVELVGTRVTETSLSIYTLSTAHITRMYLRCRLPSY